MRIRIFRGALVAIGLVGVLAPAQAATLTVNSAADAGGTCPGATCTLRQAIAAAASGDTINFVAGLTTITLTVQFDPAILRLRTVQEGSFMRTGGGTVSFNQQPGPGRVDITISKGADAVGVSGTGLLANLLFDTIGPGSATLTVSGAATGPGGTPMGLQFRPVTMVVQ